MCNFVSWIEHNNNVYFLTDNDLKPKKLKEFKDYNSLWYEDLPGHGAIRWFYPELEGRGVEHECEDFSTPENFPPEIVTAIKEGKLSKIGVSLELLNEKGPAEYRKIKDSAWAEYEKIKDSARAEYRKIIESALAEYEKIRDPARAEYEKIKDPAWAEYEKIEQPAWAEYRKIKDSAGAEYEKIKDSARAEYEKIEQPAWAEYQEKTKKEFWNLFKQEQYRNPAWV